MPLDAGRLLSQVAIYGERPRTDPDMPAPLRRLITRCWAQVGIASGPAHTLWICRPESLLFSVGSQKLYVTGQQYLRDAS